MDDRGEKIVYLAKELLESGAVEPPVTKKSLSVTLSFKTLCFTSLIAAAGGNLVSTYVHENVRPLNRYERTELNALVFYTSRLKNIHEELLREEVQKYVGVSQFDEITAKQFSQARRFLQEKAL